MERETRAIWAKRIERWKDSGLTSKQFAAELGISPRSLLWWRWRIASDAAATAAVAPTDDTKTEAVPLAPELSAMPKRRRGRKPKAKDGSITFIEVAQPTRNTSLEVVLGARAIRVPIGFDAPTFERLLAILERA